jgi:maltoporin
LLGEVGHDSFFVTNGQSFTSNWRDLTKLTGAVALCSAKGFMARPELRLFYTWAMWNGRARTAGIDSGNVYQNTSNLSGATAGLQAEAIW